MITLQTRPNFTEMSQAQLRRYISDNRNNDDLVRAAIAESSRRSGWTEVRADTPLEEQERIIKELTNKKSNQ